jgi:uncharacterized protein (TIGR03086 family)
MQTNTLPPGDVLVELDARAVRTSAELVARATAADLARRTPCRAWTLYGLLEHMATQHHGFAAASRGEDGLAAWRLRPLGEDPVGAYLESAQEVVAAFAADGVLDRAFPLPELRAEPFPADQAISFHLVDYVVHSWDVARTLGLEVGFDEDVLAAAEVVAAGVPSGPSRLAPGAVFAPEVPYDGGSRLDRLVADLGRSPSWPD